MPDEQQRATPPAIGFQGAIFDVDGVLVDSPHELAWRETLQEFMQTRWSSLRAQASWAPDRFTSAVYQELVAGKPRMAGARAALEYFGLPVDPEHVDAYAEEKQRMVVELIEQGRFTAFPDALRFLLDLRQAGIKIATASSSKNADLLLGKVRLDTFVAEHDLYYDFVAPEQTLLGTVDADISGRDFKQGKPHPEIFLTAASELGLPPAECFVVEDAVSGIQAAKAGDMAGLGIARANDVDLLTEAGADLVVTSLDDVDRDLLAERRLAAAASRAG
ncbi:MAG: HAD-IA family hydrolase [Solirubrobacterales bacterium]|nr:HAD-IA family hydrolase [Solirubrobacterales bacterium]MBV9915790.1 HAD-IA family hydrolase [Solirubrobacterales bacterium]